MDTRLLGRTGLYVPKLSFGASSLGQEFRSVSLEEATRSVNVAIDYGMNLIDTSPFYGRGMSEVLLGHTLRSIHRDSYMLSTKVGRYDLNHFDFSFKRILESVDVSLHRLGTDHVDILLAHDIEFGDLDQIVNETIPAMRRVQQQGKARFIGVSGYPMKIFRHVLHKTDLDVILSYNQYTLQNMRLVDDLLPFLQSKEVGIMNAGPFSARLLTNAPLPDWLKESQEVKDAARKAAAFCESRGVDIAKLALQFSLSNPDLATTVAGSANPENIKKWAHWAVQPLDVDLLREVQQIFAPVRNHGHHEGRLENN
jgi:aryl-alcohol dehydrogenase-like predicted oxidoreductase